MTAEFTWFRASAELSGGDRVRFVSAHGDIPAGTIATVVENSLNEMQPVLIVKPDTDEAPPPDDGDGNVWLYAPKDEALDDDGQPIPDSEWQRPCVVERVAH